MEADEGDVEGGADADCGGTGGHAGDCFHSEVQGLAVVLLYEVVGEGAVEADAGCGWGGERERRAVLE